MRYEKKYSYQEEQHHELFNHLIASGFHEVYVPRTVSSIYYDDHLFSLYNESVEGLGVRRKYRVRTYSFSPNIHVEIKARSFDTGYKISGEYKTESKEQINVTCIDTVTMSRAVLTVPRFIDGSFYPKVGIAYGRIYMVHTLLPELRVTLDRRIRFGRIAQRGKDNAIADFCIHSNSNVLEIKYPSDREMSSALVAKMLSINGLVNERHSKYCKAIEAIYC